MLTIFSCPKPFRGHIKIIQRNAIKSWTLLKPKVDIILLGNEEGTAITAMEVGIRFIPEVELNEYGTPLVNSIFHLAQAASNSAFMCYVNADIILMSDFIEAIRIVGASSQRFLMMGCRWDTDLRRVWDFERPDWEEMLRFHVRHHGKLHNWMGIDYFVFPRGAFSNMPPFALGRLVWDNWLIYHARFLRIPVIDATKAVMAIHQNHEYSHHLGGKEGLWKGVEREHNLEFAGGKQHVFCSADATHILAKNGLRAAFSFAYIWRRFYTLPVFYPFLTPLRWLLNILLKVSRPIRMKIGLTLGKPHSL